MRIIDVLFSQGFGTRRECAGLIAHGHVVVNGVTLDDPAAEVVAAGLQFKVQGVVWPYWPKALILLNKPAGYECSRKPKHHPSVLNLLPHPLRLRGMQPIGRLDEDTTGLLLLTDSGPLIHRLTSPKHHVAKVYQVGTKHPIDDTQLQHLRDGVVLDDDPKPVRAAAAERTGECALDLTLTEGKYHQVKRMLAAVGNRVESLHRSTFGAWALTADLAPGQWRWLDAPPGC
jgi:16S rRNA pseudouridine516 synthase